MDCWYKEKAKEEGEKSERRGREEGESQPILLYSCLQEIFFTIAGLLWCLLRNVCRWFRVTVCALIALLFSSVTLFALSQYVLIQHCEFVTITERHTFSYNCYASVTRSHYSSNLASAAHVSSTHVSSTHVSCFSSRVCLCVFVPQILEGRQFSLQLPSVLFLLSVIPQLLGGLLSPLGNHLYSLLVCNL